MSARPEVARPDGANVDLFPSPAQTPMVEHEPAGSPAGWSPENFAREQIQGLVRRVFLSNANPPVRQVVFIAVEAETAVRAICRRAGEALAAEGAGTVGVMGEFPRLLQNPEAPEMSEERTRFGVIPPLRRIATRVRGYLCLVPGSAASAAGVTTSSLRSYLGELRREFDFSVIEGPAEGMSSAAVAMAQFADGIILVLSAQHTRRITARKIKQSLEGAQGRLLGTVLIDRVFPIPQGIYRRL